MECAATDGNLTWTKQEISSTQYEVIKGMVGFVHKCSTNHNGIRILISEWVDAFKAVLWNWPYWSLTFNIALGSPADEQLWGWHHICHHIHEVGDFSWHHPGPASTYWGMDNTNVDRLHYRWIWLCHQPMIHWPYINKGPIMSSMPYSKEGNPYGMEMLLMVTYELHVA